MKRKMGLGKIATVFSAIFLALLFLACKNALLPVPGYESLNRDSASSDVPQNLTATQGYRREITLEWTAVASAMRYNIYKSDSPGGVFTLIDETADDTSMRTVTQPAGTDAWYRVSAVKYNGEKGMSMAVRGTTLAQPVITDIEGAKGNADSDVYVYWYMGNDDAYKKDVTYTVYAYKDGSSVPAAEKVVQGIDDKTFVLFQNLDPNTKYFYEVEAYNTHDNQGNVEKSARCDADTAIRLRPNAPSNLKVSQGDSASEIKLTFDLPERVYVDHGKEGSPDYYEHDVYFKIFRRQVGHTEWVKITDYFGKNKQSYENKSNNSEKTNLQSFTESVYTPEKTVTYTDTSTADKPLLRGVQYEYKVQSYVDLIPATMNGWDKNYGTTSDKSASIEHGWLLAIPTFRTRGHNVEISNNTVTSVQVNFAFDFETFGFDEKYDYFLRESRSFPSIPSINNIFTIHKIEKFETIEKVNDYYRYWTDIARDSGYYKYDLVIVPKGTAIPEPITSEIATKLDTVVAHGRILVSSNVGEKPVITMFSLVSGYADKFVIKWNYNADYEYELVYTEIDADGDTKNGRVTEDDKDFEQALLKAAGTSGTGEVVFEHTAASGVERTYYLSVSNGSFTTDSPILKGKTLSLPVVQQSGYDYFSVPLTIKNTGDAYKYKLSIRGRGDDIEQNTSQLTPDERKENFYYTIASDKLPSGYNDATESGKDIYVEAYAFGHTSEEKYQQEKTAEKPDGINSNGVTSTSQTNNDEQHTQIEIKIRTLGPALTDAKATIADSDDKIRFSWKEIEGAEKYAVIRNGWKTPLPNVSTEEPDNIVYIFDKTTGKISFNGSEVKKSAVSIEFDGAKNEYTLTDRADMSLDVNSTDKWARSHSRLKWGVPYDYIVLPLKANDDPGYDASSVSSRMKVELGNSCLTNVNKLEKRGAAFGYGWNVTATKGEEHGAEDGADNTSVYVTWNNPYIKEGMNVKYNIYRREEFSSDWKKVNAATVDNTWYRDSIPDAEAFSTDKGAVVYEYAVGLVNVSATDPTKDAQYIKEIVDKDFDDTWQNEKRSAGFILPRAMVTSVSRDGRVNKAGVLAEDVTWDAVSVGGVKNRMITGYIIENWNSYLGARWNTVVTKKFGETLDPTARSSVQNVTMEKEQNGRPIEQYATSISRGIASKPENNLEIISDYKHWYQVKAFNENADSKKTTSPTLKVQNGSSLESWKPIFGVRGGITWGTRGITHEDFLNIACYQLAQGLKKVKWSSTLDWWSSGTGFWSKSNWKVGWWAFVFYNFSEGGFLLAEGRLGAETNGAAFVGVSHGGRPKYYYSKIDGKVWYIKNGGSADKDASLFNSRPEGVPASVYTHSWWSKESGELLQFQRPDSWYTEQGIEEKLFNGNLWIKDFGMPDTDKSVNQQEQRFIRTYMYKGYKTNNIGHTRPSTLPGEGTDPQNGVYKNEFYNRIPFLPTVPFENGHVPY